MKPFQSLSLYTCTYNKNLTKYDTVNLSHKPNVSTFFYSVRFHSKIKQNSQQGSNLQAVQSVKSDLETPVRTLKYSTGSERNTL
jgi:hypothetical protein